MQDWAAPVALDGPPETVLRFTAMAWLVTFVRGVG
jgi:hypothetical protein